MSVKLYKTDISPAARAAMMACEIFNVPVEFIDVNLMAGEHIAPDYLKKNPLHTVPVLDDKNTIIHDSHAILMYLADAYGKNDSWYPKEVKQRAFVNQMLFFETAILFQSLRNITYPAFLAGDKKVTEQKYKGISDAYDFVEEFLSRSKYIAGEQKTIADVSCVATVSSLNLILPIDSKKYPKIKAWIKDLEKQPFYTKQNVPGLAAYNAVLQNLLEF